jgi:hypothetical protein
MLINSTALAILLTIGCPRQPGRTGFTYCSCMTPSRLRALGTMEWGNPCPALWLPVILGSSAASA